MKKVLILFTLQNLLFTFLYGQCILSSETKFYNEERYLQLPSQHTPLIDSMVKNFNHAILTNAAFVLFNDALANNTEMTCAYCDIRSDVIFLNQKFVDSFSRTKEEILVLEFEIAHQLGHIIASKNKSNYLPDNPLMNELQADYIAGYLIAKLNYRMPENIRNDVLGRADKCPIVWEMPEEYISNEQRKFAIQQGVEKKECTFDSIMNVLHHFYNVIHPNDYNNKTLYTFRFKDGSQVLIVNYDYVLVLEKNDSSILKNKFVGCTNKTFTVLNPNFWIYKFKFSLDTNKSVEYFVGYDNQIYDQKVNVVGEVI